MKTHILQLESHDDVFSTKDKIGWDQAGRIVLVWPERGRILTRKLDLVLLQRRCVEIGAQLALVTNDVEVCDNARELHIAVFKSTLDAQNNRWRSYRRRAKRPISTGSRPDLRELRKEIHPAAPRWMSTPAARLGFFALGVISFLSIVAVLLPGAQISLKPKTQLQETSLSVTASTAFDAVHLTGEVPAYTTTVDVEGRLTISTTGVTQVPEKSATGYVRFTNLTETAVAVPKGTIIKSIPIIGASLEFITTSDGDVPAGVGSTFSLPVRSMSPGTIGNLSANSLTALEGPLGLRLAVTNPLGASGGTDRLASAPVPGDYTKLAERLRGTLGKTALEEFRRTLNPEDMVITSTLTLIKENNSFDPPQPLNKIESPAAADELTLTSHHEYQVVVVSGENLRELAKEVLDASLPASLSKQSDSLEIKPITAPLVSPDGNIHWRMSVDRVVKANINESEAVNLILGKTPFEAVRLLFSQVPLEGPPVIKLTPTWWPVMPVMSFRIGLNIQ
jgi:hypothetical protein